MDPGIPNFFSKRVKNFGLFLTFFGKNFLLPVLVNFRAESASLLHGSPPTLGVVIAILYIRFSLSRHLPFFWETLKIDFFRDDYPRFFFNFRSFYKISQFSQNFLFFPDFPNFLRFSQLFKVYQIFSNFCKIFQIFPIFPHFPNFSRFPQFFPISPNFWNFQGF